MAIFSPTIASMMREKMITDGLGPIVSTYSDTENQPVGSIGINISLHSGPQPTANQVSSDWNTYKSTILAYNTASYVTIFESTNATYACDPQYIKNVNTGTASWAILWSRSHISGRDSIIGANGGYGYGGLLPADAFMVVPVSDLTTTTGVIKVFSTGVDPAVTSTTYIVNLSLSLSQT